MSDRRSSRLGDAAYAVALLVVSGIVLRGASGLEPAPFDPLGPKVVPVWISYGLIGLALAMLARLAMGRSLGHAQQSMVLGLGDDAEHVRRPWMAVSLYGLTAAYVAALSVRDIGFLAATSGYLFASCTLLDGFHRRRVLPIAVAAVAAGFVLDFVFRRVLAVDLP